MRLLAAIVVSLLAVLGCVEAPKDAVYKCATDRDCLGEERCVVDRCLARGDGGPVAHADASLPDAATAGPDAGTSRADVGLVAKPDGSVVVVVADAGLPVGVDAAVVAVPDTGFFPASCQDLLKQGGTVADGLATIWFKGDGGLEPQEVYCLQSVQSGGWTLVARSADAPVSDSFGWYQVAGKVRELSSPYCLGPLARGLKFSELLVTSQAPSVEETSYAPVGPDRFLVQLAATWAQPNASVKNPFVTDVSVAGGGCQNQGNDGIMLSYAGCTVLADHFFLRDDPVCMNYGFYAHGFALAYDGCDTAGMSGNLHEKHGLLFVR